MMKNDEEEDEVSDTMSSSRQLVFHNRVGIKVFTDDEQHQIRIGSWLVARNDVFLG